MNKFAFRQRVKRFHTNVSEEEMVNAIIQAWHSMFGDLPSKEQVTMILAQNALETGHRKSMWNYNVGNITTDGKGQYDFYDLTTQEQIEPGNWKSMNMKFRSYPSLIDGVKDYLKFLSSGHYAESWKHILNPNPVEFSKALKKAGYYTADEVPYTKMLTSLFSSLSKSNVYDKVKQKSLVGPGQDDVEETLNQYIKMLSASEVFNKRALKSLPNHSILIQITSSEDYTNAVEFSRVLCATLDEELLSKSYPCTDSKLIEVECVIAGPADECFAAVEQVTNAVAETFQYATSKIGGVVIKTNCIINKKSSYQPISLRTAETNYRKFLLKFV